MFVQQRSVCENARDVGITLSEDGRPAGERQKKPMCGVELVKVHAFGTGPSGQDEESFAGPPVQMGGKLLVGGRCIEAWNDKQFCRIRKQHEVPENFLQGLSMKNAVETASKGKMPLFVTEDEEFIIKGMSAEDHLSLMDLTHSYVDRFVQGSLLTPIYLHFRFANSGADNLSFIAMRNLTPSLGTWRSRCDLKGCADDKFLEVEGREIKAVHKRCWHFWYWRCFWSSARWRYFNAKKAARALKFELPEGQHQGLLSVLQQDVLWLKECGLMDYSLLLGVQRFHEDSLKSFTEDMSRAASSRSHPEASTWSGRTPSGRQCFLFKDLEVERVVNVVFTSQHDVARKENVIKTAIQQEGLDYADWEIPTATDALRHRGFPFAMDIRLVKKMRDRPIVRVTVGIIDFLQTWTCKKQAAQCIKLCERNKATIPPIPYGDRFLQHFSEVCSPGQHLQPLTDAAIEDGATPVIRESDSLLLNPGY